MPLQHYAQYLAHAHGLELCPRVERAIPDEALSWESVPPSTQFLVVIKLPPPVVKSKRVKAFKNV